MTVSDTGSGMDRETLKHIFEPFFTTKEAGRGTGLGLATVCGIISQNNGFINVYSEPGFGTLFKIFLPRLAGEVTRESSDATEPSLGTGDILLVEDDETIRTMTTMMLEEMGYNMHPAGAPQEAIAFCEDTRIALDMILSDVIMPCMSGKEMMEKIELIRSGIKVLYMSGYSSDIISQRGVLEEDAFYTEAVRYEGAECQNQ